MSDFTSIGPGPAPLPALSVWQAEPRLPDWLSAPHMARKDSAPSDPSFAACLDRAIRQDRLTEKILRRDSLSRLVRRRSWAGRWLEGQGVDTPATLVEGFALQDIGEHLQGRDSGVVKPVHATNAWGVFPFVRTGDFSFRALFDGTEIRLAALLDRLHAPMQRYMFPNKWQIEELVSAPGTRDIVPDDFKAYAFAGHVALILQVRRGPEGNRYKFYDSGWMPVHTGKYTRDTDMDLPPPRDPQAVMALAERVSAALPLPFCRIDMYEAEGVEGGLRHMVGELTPEPGNYHVFDPEVDRYLGVLHEWAQLRRDAANQ